MSKATIDVTKSVMSQIRLKRVKMKPRWYFVIGSVATIMGLIGIMVLSAFLVSLISFSLRIHGPMGAVRYQQLVSSFPWWTLGVIALGMGLGIFLLKKYDFWYKKNLKLILLGLIMAIVVAGWLIDVLDLTVKWRQPGRMRRMYQQQQGKVLEKD